jgi:large subunit ribosomal protein L34e
MVSPRLRSRSYSKKRVKTPGGKTTVHFKKKPTSYARCGSCEKLLLGVPRTRTGKLTKSQRVPNRPYGGNLCSRCMRNLVKDKARG